ncbi:MAG: 3'-5' exonuclease, partial [Myxococcota bacterium]|nr:3'-5' exonuclease [Myxococcota bacterium]
TEEHLRENGKPGKVAMAELTDWVKSRLKKKERALFVGHNAPFDWSFIAWTFAAENLPNPFGYKGLCTKSLATGVLGVHWLDSGKEILCDLLGLPAEDLSQKHRADYDAAYQAELLIRLLEWENGAGDSG